MSSNIFTLRKSVYNNEKEDASYEEDYREVFEAMGTLEMKPTDKFPFNTSSDKVIKLDDNFFLTDF